TGVQTCALPICLLEGAGVDASPTELVVAPPEVVVELLAALGRQRLVVHALEQTLRALERAQRLALARLLHRADRLRGELADLAAEGSRKELAERLGARGRHARTLERLAQDPARGTEFLTLRQRQDEL